MAFLDTILAHKATEIAGLDEAALRREAEDAPLPRPFLADGGGARVRLIAELKRASPSRGLLAPHLDMAALASLYAKNGASALSVLTDEIFFQGSLDTLRGLRRSATIPLPLLRKDFILSPAQVYETRAAGADAVLLIVAAFPAEAPAPAGTTLEALHALALDLGLTPLVEVHAEDELDRALALPGLRLLGINNRNLHTFEVSLATTEALRPRVPPGVRLISESGIFTAAHVAHLAALGVDAVLVGEALVTAEDIPAKVRELSHVHAHQDLRPH